MSTEKDERDELPVMVVLDKDGYLIRVGEPTMKLSKETKKIVTDGGTIKTIPFKEYRAADYKWIYDKPKELNK